MVVGLALIACGCGGSSSTSTSKSASTKTRASTSTAAPSTTATTRPAGTVVPTGSVAVVAGTPITHYTQCIAQARKRLPTLKHASKQTLEADCRQLYQSLSSQVMDFLIKADWIHADGARLSLLPSEAQVNATLNKDKSRQFPGGKGYQAFLTKTGQTDEDVRYRVRLTVIFSRLTAREKGSAAAKETAVTKREKRLFGTRPRCTPLVLMTDRANYRAG